MNTLGIDCSTNGKNELIRRLNRLKTVESATDGGEYCEDRSDSQVHIVTSMTEQQLDDWLYEFSPVDYVGVFVMEVSDA